MVGIVRCDETDEGALRQTYDLAKDCLVPRVARVYEEIGGSELESEIEDRTRFAS